jgi:hypothetical protein
VITSWRDDGTKDGGHDRGLEVSDLPVQPAEQLGGILGVERVRAQRAAQPPHRHGCRQPAAHHVADHYAQRARRQAEHVVPVTPDPAVPAGDVAGGKFETRDAW